DNLDEIRDDVPTYVTQSARNKLRGHRIRGRLLPAARTISSNSAREIFHFIVRTNLEAMSNLQAAARRDAPESI
ncbi:MAG: hypothetical protein ACREOK_03475, partial [Gemmatimonadaceae bacterium]